MDRIKYLMILIILAGCKKPYTPPQITNTPNYLVVEGVINIGNDGTNIKLSRTYKLNGNAAAKPETNAFVTVETDAGGSYPLFESDSGKYTNVTNVGNNVKYRLRIKTADKQEYLSDFEPLIITPPIDSIGFAIQNNGVLIYNNAHDPKNNTHYYRYDYVETWQFHAKYFSAFVSNGDFIVSRTPAQLVYTCYKSNISSTIVLASSAKLQQDVVFQNPILNIPSTSEKIETKYSILLRQYALTGEAYKFWINLKKNTEQLGSIFDAEPSQISGNIHNIHNPKEPVIGYISASTIENKRIFISSDQLPQSWQPTYPYDCPLDSAFFSHPRTGGDDTQILIPLPPVAYPTTQFFIKGDPFPAGYLITDQQCMDCTIRGTTTPPYFWK